MRPGPIASVGAMGDNHAMSTRVSSGEAFIDGRYVATVHLSETWISEWAPVLLSGTNRTGRKDLSHPGPAHVQFESVADAELQTRLARLIEFASADLVRQRAIRDAGQRTIGIDFVIENDRRIVGARVEAPPIGYTAVETTQFPVVIPD